MTGETGEGVTVEPVATVQEDNSNISQEENSEKSSTEINLGRMREKYEGEIAAKNQQLANQQIQLNTIYSQQNTQPKVEEKNFFTGKDGADVPTYDDLKEFEADIEKGYAKHNDQIRKDSLSLKYPNYVAIVEKYENEVPTAIVNAIKKSGDLEAAVQACMATPGYINDKANKTMHPNAQKALDNINKPKSPSSLSSSGLVSKNSKFMNMSRSDRATLREKFCRG